MVCAVDETAAVAIAAPALGADEAAVDPAVLIGREEEFAAAVWLESSPVVAIELVGSVDVAAVSVVVAWELVVRDRALAVVELFKVRFDVLAAGEFALLSPISDSVVVMPAT